MKLFRRFILASITFSVMFLLISTLFNEHVMKVLNMKRRLEIRQLIDKFESWRENEYAQASITTSTMTTDSTKLSSSTESSSSERSSADISSIDTSTVTSATVSKVVIKGDEETKVDFPELRDCEKYPKLFASNSLMDWPCQKPETTNEIWPPVLDNSESSWLRNHMKIFLQSQDPKKRVWLEEQLELQLERSKRMADVCNERKSELQQKQTFEIVWGFRREPPVIYCPVFKSGSTTWMAYFLLLMGRTEDDLMRLRSFRDEVEKVYTLPRTLRNLRTNFIHSLRFIVIRHPLVRLLSIYRDKIGTETPLPFQKYFIELQKAIIEKYRKENSPEASSVPTFSEFVDYLIDSTRDVTTIRDWETKVVEWLPIYAQCGVCSSDYNVILKLETIESDKKFFFSIASMEMLHQYDRKRNSKESSSEVETERFYRQLTKNQVRELFRIYRADFDMFGYEADEYIDIAKDNI